MNGRARRTDPKKPKGPRRWSPADPVYRDLRTYLLDLIPPKAKTLGEVRDALRAAIGRPSPRVASIHDDSNDIDSLIRLIAPELARRGIVAERGQGREGDK